MGTAPVSKTPVKNPVGRGPIAKAAGKTKTAPAAKGPVKNTVGSGVMAPISANYEADSDLRDVEHGHEVASDRKRMKAATKRAEERAEMMRRVSAMMKTGAVSQRQADRLRGKS